MIVDHYFVSIGEKSYFYTLNVDFIVKKGFRLGQPVIKHESQFIRNLSHDFEQACAKAKQWHLENGGEKPLRLFKTPQKMSEREVTVMNERIKSIKSGVIPFGKYKDQHISKIPKSYIQWVIINVYNPEASGDSQSLMAQICYDYADQKGWIDQWIAEGQKAFEAAGKGNRLNQALLDERFLIGRYKGQTVREMLFNSSGGVISESLEYIEWLAGQEAAIDYLKDQDVFEIQEEGQEKYIILTASHYSLSSRPLVDNSELSILIARQYLAYYKQLVHNEPAQPKFRFDWSKTNLSIQAAIKVSKQIEKTNKG